MLRQGRSSSPNRFLAHGSGGKLSHRLISKIIVPQFANELLAPMHDGAIFSLGEQRLAFTFEKGTPRKRMQDEDSEELV